MSGQIATTSWENDEVTENKTEIVAHNDVHHERKPFCDRDWGRKMKMELVRKNISGSKYFWSKTIGPRIFGSTYFFW